jgi:hypothetical protein
MKPLRLCRISILNIALRSIVRCQFAQLRLASQAPD